MILAFIIVKANGLSHYWKKKNQHMKPSAYKCFIPGEGQWHSSLLQKRLQCFAVVKVLLLPVNLLQHGIASVSWSV